MTQLSPKHSQNNSNGRVASPKPIPLEGTTIGTHSPTIYTTGTVEPFHIPKAPLQQRKASRWRWTSLRTKTTALAIALGTIPT
ncbi:MAG: hypothetical protein AB1589_27655, partial [Cyanobacteriota bacterium]